ncbi:hypothetical protein OO015_12670 [Thermomicrobium sp. 4228-Ro]|uniref:hypothetical protein n=1 Tax=Thermomicrobium sp. 4228-Ro TaxID=2993937 RepID=UPI0022495E56|nr:hypothetical protein [Thermomicrobium sp. 4228-Ro]MCX2728344.1 hypothetical protein [Thermomicrobium sp. 4228-Ro]
MFRYLFEGIVVGCLSVVILVLALSIGLAVVVGLRGGTADTMVFPPAIGSVEFALLFLLFFLIVIGWMLGRALLSRRSGAS